jgi:hypothetical protein
MSINIDIETIFDRSSVTSCIQYLFDDILTSLFDMKYRMFEATALVEVYLGMVTTVVAEESNLSAKALKHWRFKLIFLRFGFFILKR